MQDNLQNNFFHQIVTLLQEARLQVVRTVNHTMVYTYFNIGKMIVEEEQNGKERAEYGKQLLKGLSKRLTEEFGKGFSVDNLQNMKRFYIAYSIYETLSHISNSEQISQSQAGVSEKDEKSQTLSTIFETRNSSFVLTWSHYTFLMRIDNKEERNFYEIESAKNNWSLRELKRQYDSALYTRLSLSRDKEEIQRLSEKGLIVEKPKDIIKDPYILEFLGLPEKHSYSESDLEEEIINKLEHFLLELGNGFTFVSRQKRITFDDKHFRIDLVFYNRILKCFVLIDLKIGELKHQDLGQMQMYVNYYDREMRLEDENKTIGIVLCQNKSEAVVKYTLPENNEQIFASKYKTVLPSKEVLEQLIKEN
ncbi:putative nuclease of restriction endonuclease-like (RecB) superfamily [Flavobacterium arsenatis]|uniref:Nuclease of restriction endonuclease-like (RecB) superfamily n=1 Tax=Flavobacterium arsenatis TaxID=1484332 RepID=A0ABU1TUD9_9FLAO|nr:PDDEXK nuclease domain-containing protein [Flavobacterium arsenatis]MDR6969500.1 putative nuclease of restriction endonuclease-like (RecB) superfamily [Flavobacterium arsenatis]